MKTFGIKIIVLLLITFSNEIFGGTTDVKVYDKNLNFSFGDDKGNVYNSIKGYKDRVLGDIVNAFNIVWNEFTKNGSSQLPKCVVEAFEALRDKKINMIYFAEGIDAAPWGEYKAGKEDAIKIFNTYRATPCQLQSLIFHEMFHKAFVEMSEREKVKDQKDRSFCVKIINEYITKCPDGREVTDYECTNTFNFGSDEGIVEDCELDLFKCGLDYYRKSYDPGNEGYKDEGTREFNPPGDDCTEDKLCKKKDKNCHDDCPKDEQCPQKPPDHQDDNFSFSTGSEVNEYKLAPEALIFKGGFYQEAVNLFGGLLWDGENSAEELLKASKVLIIPSGGLYSHENDSTLKNILEEYVRRGGILITLCQQYGSNFNLIPKNAEEPLKAYGWRESQSCTWGSLYFEKEKIHPVHSALTGEKASSAVDGYFSVYPSNSTILLRRLANNEPALLYYPYGAGFVCISAFPALFFDAAVKVAAGSGATGSLETLTGNMVYLNRTS